MGRSVSKLLFPGVSIEGWIGVEVAEMERMNECTDINEAKRQHGYAER